MSGQKQSGTRERLADAALTVAILGALSYCIALAVLHLMGIDLTIR